MIKITMAVKIVADSACDLPEELVQSAGVSVVPLTVRFGDEQFFDRGGLSSQEFWERCARQSSLPETSAPSPGQFSEAFIKAAEEGNDAVVCITLSAELSSTFQSARTAAASVASTIPVHVVDSRTATMGTGLQVLHAAELAASSLNADKIISAITALSKRIRLFAVLDTMEYLKRGGRIGSAKALVGSLLSIKPVLTTKNGLVELVSKQRTRARSLQYLVDKVARCGNITRLAVMHAQAPDLEELLAPLRKLQPKAQIIVNGIGPVIGTHVGPGAVGIVYAES